MSVSVDVIRKLTRSAYDLTGDIISAKDEDRTPDWIAGMISKTFIIQTIIEAGLDALEEGKDVDIANIKEGIKKIINLEMNRKAMSSEEIAEAWDKIKNIPHLKDVAQ